MGKILFVLKKNGLRKDIYDKLIDIFKIEKIRVFGSHIIYLNDKEKFCEKFYPEQYVKYKKEIDKSFDKKVIAIITDVDKNTDIHLRIKKYMRLSFGFNIIHCSDNSRIAKKEIDILLNNKNKALFFDDQRDRKYEYKLIKTMNDKSNLGYNHLYKKYKKIYNDNINIDFYVKSIKQEKKNREFQEIKGIKYKI